jgi:calcium-dependent protein kinase
MKINNMREFFESSKLKKLIITSVANRLNYYEIQKLHELFIDSDINNDGNISYQEFENLFNNFENSKNNNDKKEKHNHPNEKYEKIFYSVDTDGSKKINYSEFIAAALDHKFYENQNKLYEAFENFDSNKDGKLSIEEFEKILFSKNKDYNDESYINFIKEFKNCDINKDGVIDYHEFVNIVCKNKNEFLPENSSNKS